MKGTAQVVKGHIKEAAGTLTGNDELRAKGQMDQAVGRIKQTADEGVRHVKGSARKTADKAKAAVNKAVY